MRRLFLFLLFFVLLFSFLAYFIDQSISALVDDEDWHYFFTSGTSVQKLSEDIAEATDFKYPGVVQVLVKLYFGEKQLKAGEYLFPIGSSLWEILQKISKGDVEYHSFQIINGWSIFRVFKALSQAEGLVCSLSEAKAIRDSLGITESSAEGWLMADTYYYTWGSRCGTLFKRSYDAMKKYLSQAWEQRASNLPYQNAYQALIIASMIEKETSLDSERPLIAGVMLKRWQKGIPLQIDSAVIYGLGENFSGKLSRADLKKPTPYNTYLYHHLPPTPISMPSKASIDAALHPANTNALYFVAQGGGNRAHIFSATLDAHHIAVQQYRKQKKQTKS